MGVVPTLPAWSVGEDITAADLQLMVDAQSWDFATRPVAFMVQTVAQTGWTSATFTAVTFTTEAIDRDGQHSTTVNTSRVTIGGTLGWYRVSGLYAAAANGVATLVRTAIGFNGTNVNGSYSAQSPSSAAVVLGVPTGTVLVQATAATDYVELLGAMTAASGTIGTAVAGSGSASSLLVEWIGS